MFLVGGEWECETAGLKASQAGDEGRQELSDSSSTAYELAACHIQPITRSWTRTLHRLPSSISYGGSILSLEHFEMWQKTNI